MKLLIVSSFWLLVVIGYGIYRYVNADHERLGNWISGFEDGFRGIENPAGSDRFGYRGGRRWGMEVRYWLGWVGYGLLCLLIILSFRWAFAP